MPYRFRLVRSTLVLGIVSLSAGTAFAQSSSVTFNNVTPPVVIPLKDQTAVKVEADGNLTAQCQPSPQGGCQGAVSGGAKANVTSFARTDSDPDITGGEPVTLGWSSSNASVCVASATPTVGDWTGLKASSGSQTVTMPVAAGLYNLGLACYNNDGSTGAKQVAVQVQEPVIPPSGEDCTGIAGPYVKPAGYTIHELGWSQAFYGYTYPLTGGPLAPVGSFSLRSQFPPSGPSVNGRAIVIPFKPDGQGTSHKLEWGLAQAIGAHGYNPARVANRVFVTLSSCKADFRPIDNQASDPLLWDDCRKYLQQGSLYYHSSPSNNVCGLQTGKQYYINIVFADPDGGLAPTENTCGVGDRCEANFKHN